MEFHLEKCKLRPWQATDAESLAKHANNKKIATNLRDGFPYPYTITNAHNWLKSALIDKNLLMAIEVDKEAVGGIGIIYKTDVYRLSAEIGYWLSEAHWGKGIMTEAVTNMVKHTFANSNIIRIYAGIFENNSASARVLLKAGFSLEATHYKAVIKGGKIMNEMIYAILK